MTEAEQPPEDFGELSPDAEKALVEDVHSMLRQAPESAPVCLIVDNSIEPFRDVLTKQTIPDGAFAWGAVPRAVMLPLIRRHAQRSIEFLEDSPSVDHTTELRIPVVRARNGSVKIGVVAFERPEA